MRRRRGRHREPPALEVSPLMDRTPVGQALPPATVPMGTKKMKRTLRRDACAIFKAAVAAANPAAMVEAALRSRRDLGRYERIFIVGAGKAGGTMARAAERVLGRRITAGCIAVKDGDPAKSRRIELRPCGHPMP